MTYEFNSLHDWQQIDTEITRAIRALHNYEHKSQLARLHRNLTASVTSLSKADVERRKYKRWPIYDEKLQVVQQQLQELQHWLVFATLIDTKSES